MLAKRLLPTLGRRSSLMPLENLRDEMDRLFNDWLGGMEETPPRFEHEDLMMFTPRVDVLENEKELKVTAELPGMAEKDVEVELSRNMLILKGKKDESKEEKGETFYRRERRFGSFVREIALPWEVDAEKVKVEATFRHGVLNVVVPKPKEAQVSKRKVVVKTA